MEVPIIIILIFAVGLCVAWFGYKILKAVVKITFIIVVLSVLGFLIYQIMV